MTVHRVYVATDARAARVQRRQLAADVWTAVRVVAAAVAVLALAPLELMAAGLGLPPVAWTLRRIAAQTRANWRARKDGVGTPANEDETEVPELSGVVIPKETV